MWIKETVMFFTNEERKEKKKKKTLDLEQFFMNRSNLQKWN